MSDIDFQNGLIAGLTLAGKTAIVGGGLEPDNKTYLYNQGDEHADITGGWVIGHSNGVGSQSKQSNYLHLIGGSSGWGVRTYVTNSLIRLTDVNTIYVEWENGGSNSTHTISGMVISTVKTGNIDTNNAFVVVRSNFLPLISQLDVSAITGDYYIRVHGQSNTAGVLSSLRVYRIWIE